MTQEQLTLAEVLDKVEGQRIAMFTSLDDDQLVARPMGLLQVDDDNTLWMVTTIDSDKAEQVRADQRVNLSFAADDYLSVSGTAEVVRDGAKAEELWNPHVDAWLQCDPTDPRVALIRVSPATIAYWETPSTPRYLLGVARGALGGSRPAEGNHGVVEA